MSRSPYLAYAALTVLLAISVVYHVRNTIDRLEVMRHGSELAFFPFDVEIPAMTVLAVDDMAREAGLQAGDTIVGIAGRPLRSSTELFGAVRRARSGDRLTLDVRSASSGSATRTVSVQLPPLQDADATPVGWVSFAIGAVALPFVCIGLGFWVAAVRPRDGRAWLVLLVLLSLSQFVGDDRRMWGRGDWFEPVAAVYQPLFANLWPSAMMLFGLYFPDRFAFDRRFPWVKWIVLVPILARVLPSIVLVDLRGLYDVAAAARAQQLLAPTRVIALPMHLVALAIFGVCMIYRTMTAETPDARRRLLLLGIGTLAGIGPGIIVILIAMAGGLEPPVWLMAILIAAVFVFPATMAYVIVVDRAMDVRVVIRQGLQYLLATGTLRAMKIAVIAAVVVIAAQASAATMTVAQRIGLITVGVVAVGLIQKFDVRVRKRIDRRFFREAYDTEQVLTELAGRVRTMVEAGPVLETVVHRIAETLHVPRVAVLLAGNGRLRLAYATGDPPVPDVALRQDSAVVRRVAETSHVRMHLAAPDPWLEQVEEEEHRALAALETALLLALPANNKLIGVMSLGPKRSEEPYSRTDVRLLEAVASQTGLALENSRLTAEIAAEVANREKAARELEIAREVQERLFPQEYPAIPGLEYAGRCRPASGVGGDYYDFIVLPDAKLGIAIGDVSGKGIPAALLMATLRAYLRGQTIRGDSNLADVMVNLNALVYESSATNRYATFFYGQFDPATRVLRYVNGGHNPPLIVSGSKPSADVVRLDVGGPVIGLFPSVAYAQGEAALAPGDVLIAFTDGISEAMSATGEDWGEDRLIAAIRTAYDLAPNDLIARIMCAADAFAAGAPQHDDMTAIVARVIADAERPMSSQV